MSYKLIVEGDNTELFSAEYETIEEATAARDGINIEIVPSLKKFRVTMRDITTYEIEVEAHDEADAIEKVAEDGHIFWSDYEIDYNSDMEAEEIEEEE